MSIVEQILANPTGGTVRLGGGEMPTTGYFVGGVVRPLVVEKDDRPEDVRDNVKLFLDGLTEDVAALRTVRYVGWWTDSETGKLYVDGTSWHAYQGEAQRAAEERDEIAFWDIENDDEIRTSSEV